MSELLGVDHGVDGKGCVEVEIETPVNGAYGVVDIIGVGRFEVLDGFEHAHGGAQTKVGAVHHFLVAGKGHHAAAYLDVIGAEFGQFLSQNLFKSLKGFGNEFKLFHL